MKSILIRRVGIVALGLWMLSCLEENPVYDENKISGIDIQNETIVTASKTSCRKLGLELVRLKGKVRYFGMDILQKPPSPRPRIGIPDVHVWLAEYPFTRLFNIRTDADGYWEMYVIKQVGRDLNVSVVYEKDHYPRSVEEMVFPGGLPEGWDRTVIKSNVTPVGSDDITDLALQMPDELFLYYAKTELEKGIGTLVGSPYTVENLTVTTVGKAWASIYDPTLPHGDPGATVALEPAAPSPLSGPIYFDETVNPNPMMTTTSIDGGVLFNNLIPGRYTMTAEKEPFEYTPVEFVVDSTIKLYISSPPHAVQGSNPSGPGEP